MKGRFGIILFTLFNLLEKHNFTAMKEKIHPNYEQTTITCACGHVFKVGATVKDMHVGICSECHPFFTGKQKFVDTAGRVEKFNRRYGKKD